MNICFNFSLRSTFTKKTIMENIKVLEVLKTAILLERRGKAFYTAVAEKTDAPDVKDFFMIMAAEEEAHINFLTNQFAKYTKNNEFEKLESMQEEDDTASEILSEKIKTQISAASFEAAAIAAAIDMETRAVDIYSERAANAEDMLEQEFYKWLAKWEQGHHKMLLAIDKDLKERIWNDNHFWPF